MTALTLERMRTDIATALDLTQEEIGDNDNLADLGLDSVRLMQLVLTWEQDGFQVDYAALSEKVTLTDWVSVMAEQRAGM